MKIVIPTLGRMDKQLTYNALPDKYKKKVNFIVQAHEFEDMKSRYGDQVIGLPEHIKTIAPTREWLFNHFKDDRFFVFDDDLAFTIKEPNTGGDTKWKARPFIDSDFDEIFELVESWMDDGISHGCLQPTWVMPSLDNWPYGDNGKIMTNVFYDGPKIPRDIKWDRVPAAEDFDVNLQLLTKGYPNRISSKYMVSPLETNAAGGCSEWRTLEVHNNAQILLGEIWPDYVKVREKEVKSGPWKGEIKLATTIYHKKAFKDSQTNSLEDFF